MKYDEFLARVRERGEYANRTEAERVARAVLTVLGSRIMGDQARDLSAQLPLPIRDALAERAGTPGRAVGTDEFLREVADQLGTASPETARWDASATLSTLAEGISGGATNQLLSQLPSGYASMFGHPELT